MALINLSDETIISNNNINLKYVLNKKCHSGVNTKALHEDIKTLLYDVKAFFNIIKILPKNSKTLSNDIEALFENVVVFPNDIQALSDNIKILYKNVKAITIEKGQSFDDFDLVKKHV
ncbi:7293_t:CDS:1 [Cetraspora pellucida]|uniref:7293_t:CDS:1 n=1 Tax=Cetraspora pellucida TaxID=1433469 RepID=A0A9N9IQX7_9GLOM|nr:7293_t:CDS:1 [Cetraspora pellucida]